MKDSCLFENDIYLTLEGGLKEFTLDNLCIQFVDKFFWGGVAFCALRFVALLWEFGGLNHRSIKAGIFNFILVCVH